MTKSNRSRLMLMAAMAIFGTLAPFVRNIAVSSAELALYRAVLAACLIGVFLLATGQKIPFAAIRKELALLLFSGTAMGFNWILLFEAYQYTTVSIATLSYYFAPVLVTAASTFLFREKLTARQVLCFVMSTVGIVLVTGIGQLAAGGQNLLGIAFGLGAAVLYALCILINKFIQNVGGIHRTFLQFLAAIAVLSPYVLLTGGISISELDALGWVNLLIVGFFHTGLTYCMYFTALKNVTGQQAAILSYIDPLVAVILSVTVLGETMSPMQLLGGVLILGFTLWNELPGRKESRPYAP